MNSSHLINIGFAVLLMTMFSIGTGEAQALGSNRNQQKMMQQLRQQQAKQFQAQQEADARQADAIAAEKQRKFEMHQKASKARNQKIEAERAAARERRLAEQRSKDVIPAKDTKPKP